MDPAVLGETQARQVSNDREGTVNLVERMLEIRPELIVMEATGGYQRVVVLGLYEAGLSVAVVHPV